MAFICPYCSTQFSTNSNIQRHLANRPRKCVVILESLSAVQSVEDNKSKSTAILFQEICNPKTKFDFGTLDIEQLTSIISFATRVRSNCKSRLEQIGVSLNLLKEEEAVLRKNDELHLGLLNFTVELKKQYDIVNAAVDI
jgi:hypothetical protein